MSFSAFLSRILSRLLSRLLSHLLSRLLSRLLCHRRTLLHFASMAASFACGGTACTHAEPPEWDAAPGSLSAAPLPRAVPGLPEAALDAPDEAAPALSTDPGTQPQTRDRPKSS